jgi:very-short-patch-repair endonuclease
LWPHLKSSAVGVLKFSRQIAMGPYIVDFVCRQRKLVVEVDGASHELTIEHDAARTAVLESAGYSVLRFTNAQIMNNLDGVIATIAQAASG